MSDTTWLNCKAQVTASLKLAPAKLKKKNWLEVMNRAGKTGNFSIRQWS